MFGWHFLRNDGLLRNNMRPPKIGDWLEHRGPLIPCAQGLHFSENVADAVIWAPGNILCRVECEGDLTPHKDPADKWVCRRRRILAMVDARLMLRRYAADCALRDGDIWDMPDDVRDHLTTLAPATQNAAFVAIYNARRRFEGMNLINAAIDVASASMYWGSFWGNFAARTAIKLASRSPDWQPHVELERRAEELFQ